MKQAHKNMKIFIIAEVIVLYFSILNIISHVCAPIQYEANTEQPLFCAEDFVPLTGDGVQEAGAVLTFYNQVKGTAVGFLADLDLSIRDEIAVQFQIDCPTQFAGGIVFIDLCNGEAGYDYPEQEYQLVLEPGLNRVAFQLNKGENAPEYAQFRIFTLDPADYTVEQLIVADMIARPPYTAPMVCVPIIVAIVLCITVLIFQRQKKGKIKL